MWSFMERIGRWGFTWRTMVSGGMIGLSRMLLSLAQMNAKATPLITILYLIVIACGAWMAVAAFVRRLHDLGWSGWWVILAPIPVAGWLQGLVLCSARGHTAENKYGPPPGKAKLSEIVAPPTDGAATAEGVA